MIRMLEQKTIEANIIENKDQIVDNKESINSLLIKFTAIENSIADLKSSVTNVLNATIGIHHFFFPFISPSPVYT